MYDFSKVHYQCNTDIFLTSKRFITEIICGELLPVIWDDEVAELLEHSFTKHNVKIRMMCGPEVYAFTDGSNPVWDVYKSKYADSDQWKLRFLKNYPTLKQGHWSDGDLYMEIEDSPRRTTREIVTHYDIRYRGPHEVQALESHFSELWRNEEGWSPEPTSMLAVMTKDGACTDSQAA